MKTLNFIECAENNFFVDIKYLDSETLLHLIFMIEEKKEKIISKIICSSYYEFYFVKNFLKKYNAENIKVIIDSSIVKGAKYIEIQSDDNSTFNIGYEVCVEKLRKYKDAEELENDFKKEIGEGFILFFRPTTIRTKIYRENKKGFMKKSKYKRNMLLPYFIMMGDKDCIEHCFLDLVLV